MKPKDYEIEKELMKEKKPARRLPKNQG